MANIKGEGKKYGLLGRKISYSLSPAMHNAAFAHFGIPAEYGIFDIEEKDLENFFRRRVLGEKISGFNVTVPYKIAVHDILKKREDWKLDRTAENLGAVNTVKVEGTSLTGYNTDGIGFYESLREDAGFDPRDKTVFIFGTGGAGRAICLYLASIGEDAPKNIYLYDVAEMRLSELQSFCNEKVGRDLCKSVDRARIGDKIAECDLVVNATPMGTKKGDPLLFSPDILREGMVVYDLVYARKTELISRAEEKGLRACGGKGMLINQAAYAFNIWTSEDLGQTKEVMKKAFLKKQGAASV